MIVESRLISRWARWRNNQATRWQFTTSEFKEIAHFGHGPNAQILDGNGRRAIQYVVNNNATQTIGFQLYSLTLDQFLDHYASGFRGQAGWNWDEQDTPRISVENNPLQKEWQIDTKQTVAEYSNVQELIIPEDVPPGLYILNLISGNLNDQLILVLTENTVVVKEAQGDLLTWVTDINGDPIAHSDMSVYARNGDLISAGQADEKGIFHTTIPVFDAGGPASIEDLIIVAQNGDDITVSGLSSEWRSRRGYFDGSWWQRPSSKQSAAYIFTDRPIYKPGQTVNFKAIVRDDDDALLTVRIRDARDNVVQTIELSSNNFGSINSQFNIADGAMLGEYHIELLMNGDSHRQIFKVEDYRKPDYEVIVTTNAEKYIADDTIEITVNSAYFFGEPVANADIILRRYKETNSWDYYGGLTWMEDFHGAGGEIRGKTDENGRFTATVNVPTFISTNDNNKWQSNLREHRWGFEATIDDGSHQTVSGFAVAHIYNRDAYLTVNTNGYAHKPQEPFRISATLQSIFDEPMANQELTIELNRYSSVSGHYTQNIQEETMRTDENGRANIDFTVNEAGYYHLRISGKDSSGKDVKYFTYVYAFSGNYSSWYGRNNDGELHIEPAAATYAPGDTAQLLIETTVEGPALLVAERGKSRDEQLVWLTPPLTTIDLPITDEYTPNIFVSINIWQERSTIIDENTYMSLPDSGLHTAFTNISVPATTKNLNVAITPNKEMYAPGEEATFTIQVTNYKGEPVSAEVSLALVDEAIFALSEELSGPMYDAFYYKRSSIVQTYHSLHPTRYLFSGGGGGGGGGDLAGQPRQDFPDTAVWLPNLQTDHNGEAIVTVTLPDNLTSWRATSKAATADTQVGSTHINMTTHKEIIVRPILPRILTAGDNIQLSTLVHNYSDDTVALTVSLNEILDENAFNKIEVLTPLTQTIELPANGVKIVGWTFKALEAGEATLLVQANDTADSSTRADAVLLPLTIQPLAVPNVQTQVGQFSTQLNSTVTIPADSLPMSNVEIQLSRSIAGTLLEGLEYLTGYPYGCVEQTMSKALPNAVVGRALNQLGVSNPTLEAELPGYINASVQRLYGFQHNDGGWGWWTDDPTHDYQTAWVIFGLAQVADAGYEVDPEVISRGVAWLNENINSTSMDPRTRAFALYAMAAAGEPNPEATIQLANELERLEDDTFSLAGLALALHIIGENEMAQEIVDGLTETAVTENNLTHWQGADHDGYYYQKTMASDIRSTALTLTAFTQIRPNHELEANIVRWLMSQRRTQGWGSTNETSFAILGLTDHLIASAFNETAANTNYTVLLNGNPIADGQLGQGAPAVTLTIPREQLADGENEIQITQDGKRPLYYTINSKTYSAQSEIDKAGVINISRKYLDPETGDPLAEIVAGQLVKIQIKVTLPQNGSYMIVEDKLPSGFEALNEGLNTTSRISEYWEYNDDDYTWRGLGYNYKEIHSDHVSFFITEMDKGSQTFTYYARATHGGTFTAMPVEAYGMYNVELWGRSASNEINIIEEK